MVFIREFQDCTHRLRISCCGLTFYGNTFAFIAHKEIKFHATVFMIEIQLATHLAKGVCYTKNLYATFREIPGGTSFYHS